MNRPVTVAVCTRDRAETLERCALPGIIETAHAGWSVVVVDQSADDRTERLIRALPGVEYLRSEPGLARARDEALRAARTPFVAFTDDDVSFSPEWPERTAAAFEQEPEAGVLCGGLSDPDGEPLSVGSPGVYRWPLNPFGLGTGGNLAFRVEAARAVGGFDPTLGAGARYLAAEDTDMIYRVARDGWSVVCVDGAGMVHHDLKPASTRVKMQFRYGIGAGAQTAKHVRAGDRHAFRVCGELFARGARRIYRGLRRGELGAVARKIAFLTGITVGFAWRLLQPRSA